MTDQTSGPRRSGASSSAEALSVGVATGAYGISFGALAVAAGLDAWQACALSLLMFTGGSQFAFVGIIAAGLHAAPAAIAASSMLGVRNGLYALRADPAARGQRAPAASPPRTSPSTSRPRWRWPRTTSSAARLGFWLTGLTVFALWNLTTLVGALVGNALGDPQTCGSRRRRLRRVHRPALAAAEES